MDGPDPATGSDDPSAPSPRSTSARLLRQVPLRDPRTLPHYLSVTGVSFAFFMGHSILLPSLPLYAASFGVSTVMIGVVVAGFAFGRLVFNAIAGATADRIGLRWVASLGCLITVGGAVLAGVAPTVVWLVAARLIQGVGSAFYLIPAYAFVASLAADDGLGQVLSLYQGAMLLGNSFGPAVGGFVAAWWGLRAPHFVFAGLVAMGLVLTLVLFPVAHAQRTRQQEEDAIKARADVRRLARERTFGIPLAFSFVIFSLRSGVRVTMLPLFAAAAFAYDEAGIGVLMTVATVANVLVIPHAGRLMDRLGRRPVVIGSMLGSTAVSILLAVTFRSWLLFVASALVGVVTGYGGSAPATIASDVAAPAGRASAIGMQRMASDSGIIAGPMMVGALATVLSLRGVFGAMGIMAFGTALLCLRMPETRGLLTRENDPVGSERG